MVPIPYPAEGRAVATTPGSAMLMNVSHYVAEHAPFEDFYKVDTAADTDFAEDQISLERPGYELLAEQQATGIQPTRSGWTCSYKRCTHGRPFARKCDLDRHVRAKHSKEKPFVCPVYGCYQKQRQSAFARKDKLLDHIGRLHVAETLAKCPIAQCGFGPSSCDLMSVHLSRAHGTLLISGVREYKGSSIGAWAIIEAAKHYRLKCPVPGCNVRRDDANTLWKHVEHVHGTRMLLHDPQIVTKFHEMRIIPTKAECKHIAEDKATLQLKVCSCLYTDFVQRCPLCCTDCVSGGPYVTSQFAIHMEKFHLPHLSREIAAIRQARQQLLALHPYYFGHREEWDIVWDDLAQVLPRRSQAVAHTERSSDER